MIQGLLGESSSSSGLINGGSSEISKLPIPSPSPSSSATAAASTTTENLRCPRCDSTNTKFCYYNNYNLTQPRHFCKTCRRYWTKGGALRNVPIGGGCRKNRTTTTTTVSSPISKSNPLIKFQKPEIGKLGNNFISSFELNELSSNPIFWASSPQNSQYLLSLLKPQNFPNSNPNLIKDEPLFPTVDSCTSLLGGLGQKQNGVVLGELQRSSGLMQDFYQRLRSSANYSNYHQGLGNIMGAADNSSSSSTILESAAVGVAADQMGYWNNPPPVLSNWSDLPTSTHGAYPN